MSQRTVIASDSTCDLPQELLEKHNITLVPLTVIKADEQFKDGVDITPDDIYAHYHEHKELPKRNAWAIFSLDFFLLPGVEIYNSLTS